MTAAYELIPAPDLVGATDIAERAGVKPNTVKVWAWRHRDFPSPVATLARGRLWRWSDVEAWLATRDTRPWAKVRAEQ